MGGRAVHRDLAFLGDSATFTPSRSAPAPPCQRVPWVTIFQKIIDREVDADIVYEDGQVLAFRDIAPQAPIHILVIPKEPLLNVAAASDDHCDLLGRLLLVCRNVARQEGLPENGYRIVTNNGPQGGQAVAHLHFHVLGGRQMTWPPG